MAFSFLFLSLKNINYIVRMNRNDGGGLCLVSLEAQFLDFSLTIFPGMIKWDFIVTRNFSLFLYVFGFFLNQFSNAYTMLITFY